MRGNHTKITKLLQSHGAKGEEDERNTVQSSAEKMCQAASRSPLQPRFDPLQMA